MYRALPHRILTPEEYAKRLETLPTDTRHMELNGADVHAIEGDQGVQMLFANDGHYALVEFDC